MPNSESSDFDFDSIGDAFKKEEEKEKSKDEEHPTILLPIDLHNDDDDEEQDNTPKKKWRLSTRDFLPIQPLFSLYMFVYLFIYGLEPIITEKCFLNTDERQQQYKELLNAVMDTKENNLVGFISRIVLYVDCGIALALSLAFLAFGFLIKFPRWLGFCKGKGYFLNELRVIKIVESIVFCASLVYFTFLTAWFGYLGEEKERWKVNQNFHMILIVCIFFVKESHPFIFRYVPFHWAIVHILSAVDIVPYVSIDRTEKYEEKFEKLCFENGFAQGALWVVRVCHLVLAIFFLIGMIVGIVSAIFKRFFLRLTQELLLLSFKLSIILYGFMMLFDSLFYESEDIWMNQTSIFCILICCYMYSLKRETPKKWSYLLKLYSSQRKKQVHNSHIEDKDDH